MISSAEKRFLAAYAALGKSIEKGVFERAAVIERKTGALQKRLARTARFECGDYVLKTDKSLGAAQLWELYMTLLEAEAGCQFKGALGLRLNFNQLEDRVDGHMLMPLPLGYGTLCAAWRQPVSALPSSSAHQRAGLPPSALDRQAPEGSQRHARLANDPPPARQPQPPPDTRAHDQHQGTQPTRRRTKTRLPNARDRLGIRLPNTQNRNPSVKKW
jgi:hypothetical protein